METKQLSTGVIAAIIMGIAGILFAIFGINWDIGASWKTDGES